jgi:hypothetical protein
MADQVCQLNLQEALERACDGALLRNIGACRSQNRGRLQFGSLLIVQGVADAHSEGAVVEEVLKTECYTKCSLARAASGLASAVSRR